MSSSHNEPAWQFFSDLLDLVVPEGGATALLSAHFDASQLESGVFSVSGFAFGKERAKKACRDWHRLWGETICHMTDLHSRKPKSTFEDWTREQAGQRLEECVRIINTYASYAVCVSCDIPEVELIAPKTAAKGSEKYLGAFKEAYGICCHAGMAQLGNLIRENGGKPSVAYFFESGDLHQAESQAFISLATATDSPLKQMYCHTAHTVVNKADARLLETADIIAWEWATHRDRVRANRHIRPSLRAMLDPDSSGYFGPTDFASSSRRAIHLTGKPLERYFSQVKQFILS